MTPFAELLQQGTQHAWLFIPSAILLGALHGLEPGHSKTMMAAFIVAVRGTVKQAVLLGLAATLSHTAVVWAVALGGMYLWRGMDAETTEPYFQLASAAIIVGVALWMLWRTYRDGLHAKRETDHSHEPHGHEEMRRIDTGHGVIAELSIYEEGVPPRFWLAFEKSDKMLAPPDADSCTIETTRPDGKKQVFALINRGSHLESLDEIPEPHEFTIRLKISHGDHSHDYDVEFTEHSHGHSHEGLDLNTVGYQDAHELSHANDIRKRFADRNVTNWQIALFGLTGGLIPCPAAITVLLLCLQLKEIPLGATLVLCFSIGLAITLVTVGAVAALSVRHATKRYPWFGTVARKAPYFSSMLIMIIGIYMGYHGWYGIMGAK